MTLVSEEQARAALAAADTNTKVAILIFNGAEIIDFAGPYEVFGAANFNVYTVAKTNDPITTAMGLTVIPKYSFDDAPQPDVLLIPGGGVTATQGDSTTLQWIRDETAHIQHTVSVCNGAFILASAGLLDGLTATTTDGNIPRLRALFPKINVVDDRRYVDNGKIITTAGLSAGIDGALHIVELLKGKGFAEEVALSEEYDWSPHAAFVRAALADRLIPNVDLGSNYGTWDLVSTEGDTHHWEKVFRGTTTKSPTELLDQIDRALLTAARWKKVSGAEESRTWKFKGNDGKPWRGSVTVMPIPGQSHQLLVKVTIAKGG
jgi:putative intracellular protease/amidase